MGFSDVANILSVLQEETYWTIPVFVTFTFLTALVLN
jgi:hypothetical protein